MASVTTINQCVSKQAYREVLGDYILNPELIKVHKLVKEDFTENFYYIVYTAIVKLVSQDVKIINVDTIEQLLNEKDYPIQHADYVKNNGTEYLLRAVKLAQEENFNYYYTLVKKYSLLRSLLRNKISVFEYFNPNDVDPEIIEEKRNKLESDTLQDIIKTYRTKIIDIASSYDPTDGRSSMKAGVGGMEQKELWKQNIAYGLSYPSSILTQVSSGIRTKRFTVMSAGTGVGKLYN